MENNKLKVGLILAAIVAVAAIGAGFIFGDPSDKGNGKPVDYSKEMDVTSEDPTLFVQEEATEELATIYKADMSAYYEGTNVASMYYVLDPEKGTYSMYYGYQEVVQGTYAVEGNEVILAYDGQEISDGTRYILEDHTLVAENSICTGEIPAEDTFDLKCTQKMSDNYVYYYEFAKDGSYKLTSYTKTAEGSDDRMSTAEGTYEKDGKFITCRINDMKTAPYLIFHDRLVTSYFEEISQEQFDTEYAENVKAAEEAQANTAAAAEEAATESVTEAVTEE